MAVLKPVVGNSARVFDGIDLVYIHCVSDDDFAVSVKGLEGVQVLFRIVHASYIEELKVRRVVLVPKVTFNNNSMVELFKNIRSPVLCRLISTSSIQFIDTELSDEPNEDGNIQVATVIWKFDLVPGPTSDFIMPTNPNQTWIDKYMPPVDLDCPLVCNCFPGRSDRCVLSSFNLRVPDSDIYDPDPDQVDSEIATSIVNDVYDPHQVDLEIATTSVVNERNPTICTSSVEESDELTLEYFKIKGSFWENRYQEAFKVMLDQIYDDIRPQFRVFHETNNLTDENAQRFDVLNLKDDEWLPLGYCPVDKIPKLVRACSRHELRDISLASYKRRYILRINKFKFEGALNILKVGRWEKSDPNNTYNAPIEL